MPHSRKIGFKIQNNINEELLTLLNIYNNSCLTQLDFLIQWLISCKLLKPLIEILNLSKVVNTIVH